jgi:hypothetical protein
MLQKSLQTCREEFGIPPREFGWWERHTYLHVPTPPWAVQNKSDKLTELFKNIPTVFSEGVVVWGQIIQANQLLFSPGADNCPGEVVFSASKRVDSEVELLRDVAISMADLKGTQPENPQAAAVAEYLTDEMIRVFGLKAPDLIGSGIKYRISTTFFVRKHLPNGYLSNGLLPLVVLPREPCYAMPLPSRYWAPALIRDWY